MITCAECARADASLPIRIQRDREIENVGHFNFTHVILRPVGERVRAGAGDLERRRVELCTATVHLEVGVGDAEARVV